MRRGREYPDHPFVGVGAFIHHDGCVLLVKRKFEPNRGRWALPGGLLEVGETLEEAAAREAREELGIEIKIASLLQVVDEIVPDEDGKVRYHYVLVDYLASPLQTEIKLNGESEEYRWVRPEEVGGLETSENTKLIAQKFIDMRNGKSSH